MVFDSSTVASDTTNSNGTNNASNSVGVSGQEGKDINTFMNRVDNILSEEELKRPANGKKARNFQFLYNELASNYRNDVKFSEALTKLQNKSFMILAQPVRQLLQDSNINQGGSSVVSGKMQPNIETISEDGGIINDEEVTTAIIMLNKSQSINKLSLDIIARKANADSPSEGFKVPMERLVDRAANLIELRAQFLDLDIYVPDNNIIAKDHWTMEFLVEAKTVAEFRNLKAEKFDSILQRRDMKMGERGKLEKLYTGEIGSQKDVEYIPTIRQEFRKANISMVFAGRFEKKGLISASEIRDIQDEDISDHNTSSIGGAARRSSLNFIRNKIKVLSTKHKLQVDRHSEAQYDSPIEDETPTVNEQQFEGDVARMRESEENAIQSHLKTVQLIDDLNVPETDVNKEELQEQINKLKGFARETERHQFVSQVLGDQITMANGAKDIKSGNVGVIQSYPDNERLVAGVSGGKALHGLCVLVNDRAIVPGAVPLLKAPEFVEILGVTQPFESGSFKTTYETESSAFEKTAKSGSITIAESSSKSGSVGINASMGLWKVQASVTAGTSKEKDSSKIDMDEEENETYKKTSKAFVYDYIKMPMRNFRIPYTSMRLSEDAKDSIMKITTERGAKEFLITYGTHIPFGMQTLGGIFMKKIYMQASKEVESTSIFSSCYETLSEKKASSVGLSATVSKKLFGKGVSVSASANFASASGKATVSTNAETDQTTTASANSYFTLTVSSLGPNSTNAEDFFNQLSNNTGTWSIIDRGELDHVRPVWELIADEMLSDNKMDNRGNRSKEHIQVRRAIQLMRFVWGQHAATMMNSRAAPYMPSTITRSIQNFLAVTYAVGGMMDAISTVIIPSPSQGDRLQMLQDLKTVVGLAKDAFLEQVTFEYDNWWIKRFIQSGMERALKQSSTTNELTYTFDVAPVNKNLTKSSERLSLVIRKMHAQAAAAAKELDEDGWEQLVEQFVPLAKLTKIPNFDSTGDADRIAKVWHVTDSNLATGRSVTIKTPTVTSTIKPMTSQDVVCADAITPITIKVIPPSQYLTYASWWRIFIQLYIPYSFNYTLWPGSVYYCFPRNSRYNTTIVTEEALLSQGHIVITNPYPIMLTATTSAFQSIENGNFDLLGDSVLILKRKTNNENDDDELVEEDGEINIEVFNSTADSVDKKGIGIRTGQKYIPLFKSTDALCLDAPTLVPERRKGYYDHQNHGSLLVSSITHRRMHQWERNNDESVINGINRGYKHFCSDQFWMITLASPPEIDDNKYYDTNEYCYLITNKRTGSRLFSLPDDGEGTESTFGFVKSIKRVEDSQKWQFLQDDTKKCEIVNVLSGHRLALQHHEDASVVEKGKGDEINPIITTDPDMYDMNSEDEDFVSCHQWYIIPWALLTQVDKSDIITQVDESDNITQVDESDNILTNIMSKSLGGKSLRILPRQTLPGQFVKENGGIIIHSLYPITFKVHWKNHELSRVAFKSRGDLSWPIRNDIPQVNNPADTEITIIRIDTGESKNVKITPRTTYHLYYDQINLFCDGIPNLLTSSQFASEYERRSGLILVQKNTAHRVGTWKSTTLHGLAFDTNKHVSNHELWNFLPTGSKNLFQIVNRNSKCLVGKAGGKVVVEDFDSTKDHNDSELWSIFRKGSNTGWYTIKNIKFDKCLDFLPPKTDVFTNVQTTLVEELTESDDAPMWCVVTPGSLNVEGVQIAPTMINPDKSITLNDAVSADRMDLIELILWDGLTDVTTWNKILIDASSSGNMRILDFLLRNGVVDINVKDSEGCTPLHRAVESNRFDIVKKLLQLGCDVFIRNSSNALAWDFATIDSRIKALGPRVHFNATSASIISGVRKQGIICYFTSGGYFTFKNVNFGPNGTYKSIRMKYGTSSGNSVIKLLVGGPNGTQIAKHQLESTGGWGYSTPGIIEIDDVEGIRDLTWVGTASGYVMNLASFYLSTT